MAAAPEGSVAVLIGTRPEAVKLAPVVHALEEAGAAPSVFLTGQHVELVTPVLADLDIKPVQNLNVMAPEQSLAGLSARLMVAIEGLLLHRRPRAVVVQGDTTSVAMGALCAFYQGIPVAHVEAGLRTGDHRNPFPEETNRRMVACLASLHFAPTERARSNLLSEGVPSARIRVVGNTVVDALFQARDRLVPRLPPDSAIDRILGGAAVRVLITAHRRESLDGDLALLCRGIGELARACPAALFVMPLHLNPRVRRLVRDHLCGLRNVDLLEPLPYLRFLQLMLSSRLVITDSGGVQEEAAALGIPFLVVRRTTERPEGVESGVGQLIGSEPGRLVEAARHLLTDPAEHRRRAVPTKAYGDGSAAKRIALAIVGEMLGGRLSSGGATRPVAGVVDFRDSTSGTASTPP